MAHHIAEHEEPLSSDPSNDKSRFLIVLVGLPARGKSYISKKLNRFLNWSGYRCEIFNVGQYRRRVLKDIVQDANFFDPSNEEMVKKRGELAQYALKDIDAYFQKPNSKCAVMDATNGTTARRNKCIEYFKDQSHVHVIFIESVCTDEAVINRNIQLKLNSPDYKGQNPETALADFRARLEHYERAYQPLESPRDEALSYVKNINVGEKVIANRMHGFIPGHMVFFLMNLHIKPRTIWLTRHGPSAYDDEERIGGDPPLIDRGVEYAKRLNEFVQQRRSEGRPLVVWTSTLDRATQTGEYIEDASAKRAIRSLNEIEAGITDGMTYSEVAEKHPELHQQREQNKLHHRNPGNGESYKDLIDRLKPVMIELERVKHDTLIIAHRGPVRALYAYFLHNCPHEEIPTIGMPLESVIELQPNEYGCEIRRHNLSNRSLSKANLLGPDTSFTPSPGRKTSQG